MKVNVTQCLRRCAREVWDKALLLLSALLVCICYATLEVFCALKPLTEAHWETLNFKTSRTVSGEEYEFASKTFRTWGIHKSYVLIKTSQDDYFIVKYVDYVKLTSGEYKSLSDLHSGCLSGETSIADILLFSLVS